MKLWLFDWDAEEPKMNKPHCLHITETPVKVSKFFSHTQSLPAINHFWKHCLQATPSYCQSWWLCTQIFPWNLKNGAVCSSLSNPAGLTRPGWECPVGCYHFMWLFAEEKHVLDTASESSSLLHLENNTANWVQHSKFHEPWIQSRAKKEGRLICCPSNPDYLFKHKFNFLIKCWKKFLQQHDYSRKKVQGTNKLPPPAPSQSVLAL